MKTILGERGDFTIEAGPGESLRDIAAAVILASYSDASPMGMGFLRAHDSDMTKDMAYRMLDGEDVSGDYCVNTNKPNNVYMDYVFGRCCKTRVEVKEGPGELSPRVTGYISTRDRNPRQVLAAAERLFGTFEK